MPLSVGWKSIRSYSSEKKGLSAIYKEAKEKIGKYGACGTFVLLGISIVDFMFFYALVSSGVDVTPIVNYFSLDGTYQKGVDLAIAYGAHKLFLPFRLALTMYITPMVFPYWKKYVLKRFDEMKKKKKDDDDDDD